MTFDEAVAVPGRKVQILWPEVEDGKRLVQIYSLADDGAKKLASRQVPEGDYDAVVADLKARGLTVAETDYHCDFVWATEADGIAVYDRKRKVFEAVGDRATLADGKVFARADFACVMTYVSDDYIHRGVKAALQSGQEVELVPEISLSAMADPAYTRNELLMETGWTATLGHAIATWAGTSFNDRI